MKRTLPLRNGPQRSHRRSSITDGISDERRRGKSVIKSYSQTGNRTPAATVKATQFPTPMPGSADDRQIAHCLTKCTSKLKLKQRACPGVEPQTSRTLSENHAPRPRSHAIQPCSKWISTKPHEPMAMKECVASGHFNHFLFFTFIGFSSTFPKNIPLPPPHKRTRLPFFAPRLTHTHWPKGRACLLNGPQRSHRRASITDGISDERRRGKSAIKSYSQTGNRTPAATVKAWNPNH